MITPGFMVERFQSRSERTRVPWKSDQRSKHYTAKHAPFGPIGGTVPAWPVRRGAVADTSMKTLIERNADAAPFQIAGVRLVERS